MSSKQQWDPKSGPLSNLSQAFFGGLDAAARSYEPVIKGFGRLHLEWSGLAIRRMQAWSEVPARLSQCKSPQDLLGEQTRFWQIASEQYAEGGRRILAATSACVVVPGLPQSLASPWGSASLSQRHDYITFPEPKEEPASAPKRDGERRAA